LIVYLIADIPLQGHLACQLDLLSKELSPYVANLSVSEI